MKTGGAEGIRTDGHRGRSEISSYSSLRQSMCQLLAACAFSIAIDALASVALLWAPLAGVAEVASL